jgi:hypothetical protein
MLGSFLWPDGLIFLPLLVPILAPVLTIAAVIYYAVL